MPIRSPDAAAAAADPAGAAAPNEQAAGRDGPGALSLRGRRLTGFPPAALQMLDLVELDLSHNAVPALPAALGRLPQLRRLDVSHNRIALRDADPGADRQLPPPALAGPRLHAVDLRGNPIEVDWQARLRAAAPHLALQFDREPAAAEAPRQPRAAVRDACATARALRDQKAYTAALQALQAATAAAADATDRAALLLYRGKVLQWQRDFGAAQEALRAACDEAAGISHGPSGALALAEITFQEAMCLHAAGRPSAAAFAAAMPWLRAVGHSATCAPATADHMLHNMAFVLAEQGGHAAALATFFEVAARCAQRGDADRQAYALRRAAACLEALGDAPAARRALTQARAQVNSADVRDAIDAHLAALPATAPDDAAAAP